MPRQRISLVLVALFWLLLGDLVSGANLEESVSGLDATLPRSASAYSMAKTGELSQAAAQIEEAASEVAQFERARQPRQFLDSAQRLLTAKQRVDQALDETLALRVQFASDPPDRAALRNYLQATSQLIDLSGRLRYLSFDAFNTVAGRLATSPADRERFIDLLADARSSVGAVAMAELLTDPPADSATARQPPSAALRSKVLDLIDNTNQNELLGEIARFVRKPRTPPALVIQAAETIRRIGLPQDPGPDHDPTLPAVAITARELRAIVGGLDASRLGGLRNPRDMLLKWLDERIERGLTEPTYQLGACQVRPGDWLLMRNPSPFNLFTDLSPGLFTHVGVVALEKGSDGIARMVVVDLPERGERMPATNVDTFIKRTRHYVILRHKDPAVGQAMGAAAAATVGNEIQFDLNFRTDRVLELKGQPLAGKRIHTYCAGLLLLCALQTDVARENFFPLTEYAAGGNTVKNLEQLGISIGADFISPTGALFSPVLTIVGGREPMYDPRREIEEAVFDQFAAGLAQKQLAVSADLFQSLRLKMAEASKDNPLLAEAIAKAAGVSAQTDLVSAAKAAAVVETLDEIATGASDDYLEAQQAIRAGPIDEFVAQGGTSDELADVKKYRQRHAQLFQLWSAGRLAPRQLRIELVKFYVQQGSRELDRRFFAQAR